MKSTKNIGCWVAAILAVGFTAEGSQDGFVVPGFRGQADTTFAGWENFSVAVGAPGNAGDQAGSDAGSTLWQTAPGALVLGSGNIYNGSEASLFEVRYDSAGPVGTVVFQMRTLGTELAYDSVRLVAVGSDGPISLGATRTELDRVTFGPPPPAPGSGFGVSSSWTWDVSALGVQDFVLSIPATEINLSLDSATLDVQLVPEAGPVTLLVMGGVVLGLLPSRRRRTGA
jgi:hypothetical protein